MKSSSDRFVKKIGATIIVHYFCNSGNITLLHIHQCISYGNMMPANQKRNFEGRKIIFVVESKYKKVLFISHL